MEEKLDTEQELEKVLRELRTDYETKINALGASEFSAFEGNSPDNFNVDEMKSQREFIIKHIEDSSPIYRTHFFFNDIEASMNKEVDLPSDSSADLARVYQREIEYISSQRKIITSRISNSPKTTERNTFFGHYLVNISKRVFQCESCKQAAQFTNNPSLASSDLMIALKSDFTYFTRKYSLSKVISFLKLYPLIRKESIVSHAARRFHHDMIEAPTSFPLLPTIVQDLDDNLSRLAQILGIKFDLEAHDGNHFFYNADRLFADSFRTQLEVPKDINCEHNMEKEDILFIINNYYLNEIPNVELAQEILHQFSIVESSDVSSVINMLTSRLLRSYHLPRDRVTCLFKLQFIRCRMLLHDIIENMHLIHTFKNKFEEKIKIPLTNYYEKALKLFHLHCIKVFSKIIPNLKPHTNLERIFEIFFELTNRFLEAKISILNALETISLHSDSEKIAHVAINIIDKEPTFIAISDLAFVQPYKLLVEEYESMAKVIQTVINLEVLEDRRRFHFQLLEDFNDLYPTSQDIQLASTDIPISYFEVIPQLENLIKIIDIANLVSSEISDSINIRVLKFQRYVNFSVWNQLLIDLKHFSNDSLFPFESFGNGYFARLSHEVIDFLTLPVMSHWPELENFVNSVQESRKARLIQSLRRFLYLGNKLRLLVFKTQHLLEAYSRQIPEGFPAKSKEVTFASQLMDFSNYDEVKEFLIIGDFAKLRRFVDSQRRMNILLSIAIRFNNFSIDNRFLSQCKNPEMFVNTYDERINKIFCNLHDFPDFTNKTALVKAVLPFAYRIEMAMLSNFEREFLSHNTTSDIFVDEINLYSDNQINPTAIPKLYECLTINEPDEIMQTLIKFMSIRLRLMYLVRLEWITKQKWVKVFEPLFNDTFTWDTPYFSRMFNEMVSSNSNKDLTVVTTYFEQQEQYMAIRMVYGLLLMLEDFYTRQQPGRFPFEEEPVKQTWNLFNKSFWSSAKFLTSRRYYPMSYNQLLFPLSEQMKNEYSDQLNEIDNKVSDSLLNVENADQAKYCQSLLSLTNLKFVFFILSEKLEIVSINDSVLQMNKKLYENGNLEYGNHVVLNATQKLGSISKKNQTELLFQEELKKSMKKLFDKHLMKKQIIVAQQARETLKNQINQALSASNALLKPDCYSNTNRTNLRRVQLYLPSPNETQRHFQAELRFAISRIIFTVNETLTNISKNGIANAELLEERLKELTPMIEFVVVETGPQMLQTWLSYLSNNMKVNKMDVDNHLRLNTFITDLVKRLGAEWHLILAGKMSSNFHLMNSLEHQKKVLNQKRKEAEREMIARTRKEFDQILDDLEKQIKNTRAAFYKTHDKIYQIAIDIIESKLTNPETVSNKVIKTREQTEGIGAQTMLEIEELKKQIVRMRISRTLDRMACTSYYSHWIAKVADDKRSMNASLWFGRRQFEEDQMTDNKDLKEAYQYLSALEIDSETKKAQLHQEKRHTAQLMHWRATSIKRYDLMINEHKKLSKHEDVNITQLLKKIDDADTELESLIYETDEIEDEINMQVREPMAELDRCRARIRRTTADRVEERKNTEVILDSDFKFLQRMMEENKRIDSENSELKQKILELEKEKSELNDISLKQIDGIFDPPPRLPKSSRNARPSTVRKGKKIVRPTFTARGSQRAPVY